MISHLNPGRFKLIPGLIACLFSAHTWADYGTDQTGYAATGRYDLIEKQVEALAKQGPLRTRDQHALCFAYSKLKRYDKLLACLDDLQALVAKGDRRTRIFGLDDATPAMHLMRAEALTDLGQYAQARKHANDALIWLRKEGSGDQDMVVNAYAAIAVAVALQGDMTLARQTTELLKGFSVRSDYRRAKAMALARAQMAVGAWADVIVTLDSSEASFQFDKMLDNLLSGAAFSGRNNWVWVELPRAFMLHKAQLEVGRLDAAKAGFDKLLATPELTVNAEIHWQALLERGRIAEKEGDMTKALDYFRRARALIDSQRRSIRTETSKIGFTSDKQAVYHGMVRAALKLGEKALVVEVAEQAKSRALVDMLAAKSDFGIHGERAQEVAALFSQFQQVDAELSVQAPDTNAGKRAELISQQQNLAKRLQQLAPQLASLVTTGGISVERMAQALGPQETLVGFFSPGGSSLYGYSLSGAEIRIFQLDGQGLAEDTGELVQSIKKRRRNSKELAEIMYKRLLGPMQASLRGRDLLIVPHGSLHYVPFAALHDGERYLMQGRALRILPSAHLLGLAASGRAGGAGREAVRQLLILGNPDLEDPSQDLPAAQIEAQDLKAMFSQNSELFVRRDATETLLKTRAQDFSHIHVASHGEFSADAPLQSRLKLAKDGSNDGMLSVNEIYGLKLNANLVMLSACETGLGSVSTGDDVVGLTRGFLYAGAQNVVGSLWEVDDDATAELSRLLYASMKKGLSVAKALAEAQEQLLRKKPHPYFWAAFQNTGSGR
jgi:CHAT domain-containing protein